MHISFSQNFFVDNFYALLKSYTFTFLTKKVQFNSILLETWLLKASFRVFLIRKIQMLLKKA